MLYVRILNNILIIIYNCCFIFLNNFSAKSLETDHRGSRVLRKTSNKQGKLTSLHFSSNSIEKLLICRVPHWMISSNWSVTTSRCILANFVYEEGTFCCSPLCFFLALLRSLSALIIFCFFIYRSRLFFLFPLIAFSLLFHLILTMLNDYLSFEALVVRFSKMEKKHCNHLNLLMVIFRILLKLSF